MTIIKWSVHKEQKELEVRERARNSTSSKGSSMIRHLIQHVAINIFFDTN